MNDNILNLKNVIKLDIETPIDDIIKQITNKFDYQYDGIVRKEIPIPNFPKDFEIGLIVGKSGGGKSTLLRNCFGEEETIGGTTQKQ